MSRRLLLALSAAASAFILVVVGAVASYALRTPPPPPSPTVASAAPTDSVPVDVVLAREAEYRRLIDEANARLRAGQAAATAPVESPSNGTARAVERGEDEEHGRPRTTRRHHHEHEEHEHGEHDG